MRYILIAVIAYLLGNFSTGLILSKLISNKDIRNYGSHSAGATNMLRTFGWLPSVGTLLGDALKAFIATYIGKLIGGDWGVCVGGIAVIVGHNWPVFYGFKGGKGIACTFGYVLFTTPVLAIILLLTNFAIVGFTGYMSIASISVCTVYPIIIAIMYPGNAPMLIAAILICLLAVYSHRENIKRLIHHEEHKLVFAKISQISRNLFKKRREKK